MTRASGRPRHGGAGRILVLASRTLRHADGVVAVAEADGLRVLTGVGDAEALLPVAARAVAEGGVVREGGALAVPLHADDGRPVGALCLGAPDGAPDETAVLEALVGFAAVLSEQLDLLRQLGPPPAPEAVARLEEAIDCGRVRAWFQPIVRLDGEGLVGFEALARWRDDDGEVARPGEFVPLAEQAGLVGRLDHAVLVDAVAHLAVWHRTDPRLRLSVNVSGRHLDDPGWLDGIDAVVRDAGVDPATLDLELTETVRPSDVVASVAELQRARTLGYAVWLDDFGTGWSELRHLVELPVDGVKVDRFFTEALGGRGDAVVRGVVQIAEELGLDTVVEGVSRPDHAQRAGALGCHLAQGFLWSPAVPPDEVAALVAAGPRPLSRSGR